MTDDEIASECERKFQNGGPRIYAVDRSSWSGIRPSHQSSGKQAMRLESSGAEIWQRRKARDGKYRFVKVGVAD